MIWKKYEESMNTEIMEHIGLPAKTGCSVLAVNGTLKALLAYDTIRPINTGFYHN